MSVKLRWFLCLARIIRLLDACSFCKGFFRSSNTACCQTNRENLATDRTNWHFKNTYAIFGLAAAQIAFPLAAFSQNDYSRDPPSDRIRQKATSYEFDSRPPVDCDLKVSFAGESQSFAQIRYGTEDSTRVMIVLDQLRGGRNEFDLYVDLDRDRTIEAGEKISGTGKLREFDLPAEIMTVGVPEYEDRRVQFRRSLRGPRFSLKTLGGYVSECQIGGKSRQVWRVDGDANGLYSDADDELWIDLNVDGQWNRISERFLFRSAIKLEDQRLAVRANRTGSKISFAPIEGEGELKLDLELESEVSVARIKASIYGDDGSAHSISDMKPITLPIGKYMLGQISFQLKREDEPVWNFSFAHSGNPKNKSWFEVTKSESTTVVPFREVSFRIKSADQVSPGNKLSIRPILTTADNLRITGSDRGKTSRWGREGDNPATVKVIDSGQKEIFAETSGFA